MHARPYHVLLLISACPWHPLVTGIHITIFGVIHSSALFQYWKDVLIIPIWNWNPIGIQFQIGDAVDLGRFFYKTNDHFQLELESNSKLDDQSIIPIGNEHF